MRLVVLWAALGLAGAAQAAIQVPPEAVPVPVANLIQQGDRWEAQARGDEAVKAYERANKLDQGNCVSCLMRLAALQRDWGRNKDALKTALEAESAAAARTGLAGGAHEFGGEMYAILAGYDHPKAELLKRAEAEFRAALVAGDSGPTDFKLAVVLLREGRREEGSGMLNRIVANAASAPELVQEARDVLAIPALIREPIVPEFSLTAEDGRTYTKQSLRGKVVLFDFWGTWCPPCRDSVPMLKSLNQEFSKDADFVLVGISSDPDAKAWRSFVAAEKMDWVEALDSRFHTIGRFGVREFPTYIVMDRVGGVRLVTTGLAENFYGGDSMETRMAIVKAVTAALRSTER